MIRIPEYLEKRRAAAGEPAELDVADRHAARPDRARLVQGLADPSRSRGRWPTAGAARAPTTRSALAPLADGGEGTLIAIEAAGGWLARRPTRTTRWAGRSAPACCAGTTAAARRRAGRRVRAVAASRAEERDAAPATSVGTGQVLRRGARRRDPRHRAGHRRQRDDRRRRGAAPGARGATCQRRPATAVDLAATSTRGWPRPGCGSRATSPTRCSATGAAATYGPQKGATPSRGRRARRAPRALRRRARGGHGPPSERDAPGAGAAGGDGFGLLAIADRFADSSAARHRPRDGADRLRRGARGADLVHHRRGPDRRARPPSARPRSAWRSGRGRPARPCIASAAA